MSGDGSQNLSLNSDVLEKIFSYLTFKDLTAAELVCKSWKHVIDNRCDIIYICQDQAHNCLI